MILLFTNEHIFFRVLGRKKRTYSTMSLCNCNSPLSNAGINHYIAIVSKCQIRNNKKRFFSNCNCG
jgi:hypothetical protein